MPVCSNEPRQSRRARQREAAPHRRSKAVDGSCRNHGGCRCCEEGRRRKQQLIQVAEEEQKATENERVKEFVITNARYARGMMLVRCPSADGFKTRAARLIGDGLRARWTSRECGYVASPARVEKFKRLFAAGWDASCITGQLEPPEDEEEEEQANPEAADPEYIAFNTCDVCGDSGRHVRFGGRMFMEGETMTPWMCPKCATAHLAEEEQAELLGEE